MAEEDYKGGVLIEKVSTGIDGLDDMLYGGIPKAAQVLVVGEPGTGKTLMSFETLYRNAQAGIATCFISTEEGVDEILKNLKSAFEYFDDIDELISKGLLNIKNVERKYAIKSREESEADIASIEKTIEENKATYITIDSLTVYRTLFENDKIFTRYLIDLTSSMKKRGLTVLYTLESSQTDNFTEIFGLYGTYMFDGIIKLYTKDIGGSYQYLVRVVKMRGSNHKTTALPYQITSKGIRVFK
ncbi:MAG: UPF0273 protein [Candidatus Micrarchaeota archaeon]|nr:MAG: UPF0273 protein [Candidatus Micrarchaeota archaeon]